MAKNLLTSFTNKNKLSQQYQKQILDTKKQIINSIPCTRQLNSQIQNHYLYNILTKKFLLCYWDTFDMCLYLTKCALIAQLSPKPCIRNRFNADETKDFIIWGFMSVITFHFLLFLANFPPFSFLFEHFFDLPEYFLFVVFFCFAFPLPQLHGVFFSDVIENSWFSFFSWLFLDGLEVVLWLKGDIFRRNLIIWWILLMVVQTLPHWP